MRYNLQSHFLAMAEPTVDSVGPLAAAGPVALTTALNAAAPPTGSGIHRPRIPAP